MSDARMKKEEERLEREVGELLAAARQADADEDEIHGEDIRGDEVPEALRGRDRRLAAIREARARLDAGARDPGRPGQGRDRPRRPAIPSRPGKR